MQQRIILAVLCGLALALFTSGARAKEEYKLGPDSQYQTGVPKGEVTYFSWTSKVFPGTRRDCWLYIPKQYDPKTPASVMIFQDGGGFQDVNGGWRVPVVFDNLIHKKEMPVTVGIFLNPGVVPNSRPDALPRFNRSVEYDAPTDQYARFLLEEVLPEVEKKVNLTHDPNGRGLAGASSGGICAFTAAWERPDQFRRVLSFVGSFTNLRGGHLYGSLIRKYEPRPLRVFLQDGIHDQDIYSGNWYIGNQDVYAALQFARCDSKFVTGTGGHDGVQGGAILPDALRWLWRDSSAPIRTPESTPQPIMQIVQPGETWQQVRESEVTDFAPELARGIRTALNKDDSRKTLEPQVVNSKGECYAATVRGEILLFTGKKRRVVWKGVPSASGNPALIRGLTLTPDQTLLIITLSGTGQYAYSMQVQADGSLDHFQPFFDIVVPYGESESGAAGMVTDTNGWLYVASKAGVQVLDQAGRVNGILDNPERTPTTWLAFGGKDRNILYAVAGSKLYQRKLRAKGVVSSEPPIKPPSPRL